MQSLLTRKLTALALYGLFLGAGLSSPVVAQEPLQGDEQATYLQELKRLYLTDSARQALLAHSNALLDTYALRAGYQVGQAERQDLLYRFSLAGAGELLLREENRRAQGTEVAVRNQRIVLFGVDPFVRYECPNGGIRCVLLNPGDDSPMLSILRDHHGAAELAKALSFLIRDVQKG